MNVTMIVTWQLVMVLISGHCLMKVMATSGPAMSGTDSKDKRSVELQTAYVYRKASQRSPHYSVILGSSGKSVQGPALLPMEGDEIHRVQGFLINNDEIETEESSSFAAAGIFTHKRYRKLHHASPLTWSDRLARQAKKVAYSLAKKPSRSKKRSELIIDTIGENVERLFSVSYSCDGKAAIEAVGRWYNEGDKYSYAYPHLSDKTNSFTQLVWKGTNTFGMGCALKKGLLSNDVFVVALYSPPGNAKNELESNVLRSGKVTQKDDVYSNIF